MIVTVDKYTRFIMTVIAVLLFVVCVGMWTQTPTTISTASAAIPDSGQQLNDVIDGIERLNVSVNSLEKKMVSGEMKVQIVEAKPVKKTVKPKR